MYTLTVSRFHVIQSREHPTLREAVEDALDDLESGGAWPLEIRSGGKAIWTVPEWPLAQSSLEALLKGCPEPLEANFDALNGV